MSEHANELGFNPHKLVVMGGSAGGNLAAGVALLARDRSGPEICGQVLIYPVLNDSVETASMQQFADTKPWTKVLSADACRYALGEDRSHSSIYAVPLRAKDLARLPPAFIDVGEADLFRDDSVEYASALWKSGVPAELHVYGGCWHGFDLFVPNAPISQKAKATRREWVRKLVGSS